MQQDADNPKGVRNAPILSGNRVEAYFRFSTTTRSSALM